MTNRYDIAIVGTGPAGLSAAINAKIRNKKILIFGNESFSNKLIKAPKINNFLGLYNISGRELKLKFEKHIKFLDINIQYERINSIYSMGDYFILMSADKQYEATSIIISTGIEYTKPILGEEKLLGKGVGYCATCDAPLYKGKNVAIIGYSKEAEKEANYVNEITNKLYYIPMYKDECNIDNGIEVIRDIPKEIYGEKCVSKLILKNGEINVDGVFVLKDSVSPDKLVPGLKLEDNHIKVDASMKTNIEGCFAAGDCVGKPYQYIKAAGQGQIAALNAVKYIDTKK